MFSVPHHGFVRHALILLLVSSAVFAGKPQDPSDQSVPKQLAAIQETLAKMEANLSNQISEMETALSTQISNMEDRLNQKLSEFQSAVETGDSSLSDKISAMKSALSDQTSAMQEALSNQLSNVQIALSARLEGIGKLQGIEYDKLDSLLKTVSKMNETVSEMDDYVENYVTMSAQLCFDLSAGGGVDGNVQGELGVGWGEAVDAKVAAQLVGDINAAVGLSQQVCIDVPLYAVDTDPPIFDDTAEFDTLVSQIGTVSQNIVPAVAQAYTVLMPTPEQAVQALTNITSATPEELRNPYALLQPIIPPVIDDFVQNTAVDLAEAVMNEPCSVLSESPLGPALDQLPDWLCTLNPDSLYALVNSVDAIGMIDSTVSGIQDTINVIYSRVNALYNTVPNTFDDIYSTMGRIQGTVKGLQSSVDSLQNAVNSLQNAVKSIKDFLRI